MCIARRLWLLSLSTCLVSACATSIGPDVVKSQFSFRAANGKVLILDLKRQVISTPEFSESISNCSSDSDICYQSPHFLIRVPRECSTNEHLSQYIHSSDGLKFLSLQGLSGNIVKYETNHRKFSYAYNFSKGIVSMMVLPLGGDLIVSEPGPHLDPFRYNIEGGGGPFPCR